MSDRTSEPDANPEPENKMKTAIKNESFEAAKKEGLSFFWASMHVGDSVQFVGQSWEEGGFSVDSEGNPVSDVKGNAVAKHSVETLSDANKQHVSQCEEWYGK